MKTCHIVFQTHWDREWYLPFETFRYRLTHVIKRVLDALENKEIDKFILDGQTLPLEDFLEVAEDSEKEKVLKFIKEEKIIIGPWYIAMDEFLVSGESIVRNLEIGIKTAESYGKNQYLGYLPDTFGHIGQMPQILNNFNMNDAMMWRGIDLKHSEFIWEGKDGSKLFTIFLSEGYYIDGFNQDQYVENTHKFVNKIAPKSHSNHILMTAGGDHLMPVSKNLKERISNLNETIEGFKFVDDDYTHFIKAVKAEINEDDLEVLKGELRVNTNSYILPNVLSTRSYLKILNQKLEDEMTAYIEPMLVISHLGKNPPLKYIEHIWKTILQNQPHDSICGCSVDDVHIENELRAKKAFQMIDSLKHDIQAQAGLKPLEFHQKQITHILDDDHHIVLFNPNPYAYDGMVSLSLYFHQQTDIDNSIKLKDQQGRLFDGVITHKKESRLFESPLDYPPAFRKGYSCDVVVEIKDLKPLAFTVFEIIFDDKQFVQLSDEYILENELVKIELKDDGTLDVFDKVNQSLYDHWHEFFSSLDAGDSYNYSKPFKDHITYAKLVGKPHTTKSKLVQKMDYQLILTMPKGLKETRDEALSEMVETTIDVSLTLYENQSQVFVKTEIDQKGMDQRLRIRYDLKDLVKHSYSDQAYEILKRDANRKEAYSAQRLKEVDVVVDPSLSFIYLANENHGLEFFHRGLHEYQTPQYKDFTNLEVTLIRSVSHLSRDDFKSRGGAAGPNLETKDAQNIRKVIFEYAFGPIKDNKDVVESYMNAKNFRKPVIKLHGQLKEDTPTLFSYDHPFIDLTSLRLIDEHQIEVRLVNLSEKNQEINFDSQLKIKHIQLVKMNRQVIDKLIENQLLFKPFEIKTIIISI